MKDIAEHILDITQNSIRAGADVIRIEITESEADNSYLLAITDNGSGMDTQTIQKVIDPFFTSRTTRKVGLGIPLLKQNTELAGGSFQITSELGKGTVIQAVFQKNHMDRLPVGDLAGTYSLLIAANPDLDFEISHTTAQDTFSLNTREIKKTLDGVSINHPEVRKFIKAFLLEGLQEIGAEK